MLIENITQHLIDSEVEYLLANDSIDIDWVNKNYNGLHFEQVFFNMVDVYIQGSGNYARVFVQMIENYVDDNIDFHYLADSIRNEYISKKKNPPIIQQSR